MPPKKNQKKRNNNFNKKFNRQRQRRVEVKRREHAEIAIQNSSSGTGITFSANYPDPTKATAISASVALSMMPIRSFYRMSKGTRPNQMIGNEVFSKSLYMKGKITGLPANNTIEAFLYWGWIKDRLGYTDFTTPTRATATREDLEDFVLNQLKQHFDEKSDEMRYRQNKSDNIKITGVRKLQHPNDAQLQDQIAFKCSWKTGRKVVYTKCLEDYSTSTGAPWKGNNSLFADASEGHGEGGINLTDTATQSGDGLPGDIGTYLPLNSWLPFALVYVPEYASVSPGTIQIQYNDIHYFTG